jgi:hypothetical protein
MSISQADKTKIAQYWAEKGIIDFSYPQCFACRDEHHSWGSLTAAHVIADSIGGTKHPENIALLCKPCHFEAPMTNDPIIFWLWQRAKFTSMLSASHQVFQEVVNEFEPRLIEHILANDIAQKFEKFLRKIETDRHTSGGSSHRYPEVQKAYLKRFLEIESQAL